MIERYAQQTRSSSADKARRCRSRRSTSRYSWASSDGRMPCNDRSIERHRWAWSRSRCAHRETRVFATRRSGFVGSYVIVDDLLRNTFGELNGQLVCVNCRYGSITKHRVRNIGRLLHTHLLWRCCPMAKAHLLLTSSSLCSILGCEYSFCARFPWFFCKHHWRPARHFSVCRCCEDSRGAVQRELGGRRSSGHQNRFQDAVSPTTASAPATTDC